MIPKESQAGTVTLSEGTPIKLSLIFTMVALVLAAGGALAGYMSNRIQHTTAELSAKMTAQVGDTATKLNENAIKLNENAIELSKNSVELAKVVTKLDAISTAISKMANEQVAITSELANHKQLDSERWTEVSGRLKLLESTGSQATRDLQKELTASIAALRTEFEIYRAVQNNRWTNK